MPSFTEFENFNNLFKLPADILKELEGFSSVIPFSKSTGCQTIKKQTCKTSDHFEDVWKDEGYESSSPKCSQNIWELVSKMKYSDRKNWENFGYPEPDKELPFLSELGDLSSLWVENLESLYLANRFRESSIYNSKLVPRKIFIQDLKYLLGKFLD